MDRRSVVFVNGVPVGVVAGRRVIEYPGVGRVSVAVVDARYRGGRVRGAASVEEWTLVKDVLSIVEGKLDRQ